uniref:uncharacterized protein LOC129118341 n=1 Tax=Agelaius phoeniceus TaxID=39638 RepID=UPI0023EDEE5D|nr:uncharacterized protein LOC129118341 [Agelaius phoeniceus]
MPAGRERGRQAEEASGAERVRSVPRVRSAPRRRDRARRRTRRLRRAGRGAERGLAAPGALGAEAPGNERGSESGEADSVTGSNRERRCSECPALVPDTGEEAPLARAKATWRREGVPRQDGARLAGLVLRGQRDPCGPESAKIKVLTERPQSADSVRTLLCVFYRSEHRGKLGVMLGVGGVKSREVVPHPPWILLGISPAAEPSCCGVEHCFSASTDQIKELSWIKLWHLLFLNDFNSSFGLTDQICHQLCHFPTKTGRKHTKTEKRISTARSIFSSLWTTKYSDLVETNISLLSSFFHHLLSLSPTRKIYMNSWKSLQKPKS